MRTEWETIQSQLKCTKQHYPTLLLPCTLPKPTPSFTHAHLYTTLAHTCSHCSKLWHHKARLQGTGTVGVGVGWGPLGSQGTKGIEVRPTSTWKSRRSSNTYVRTQFCPNPTTEHRAYDSTAHAQHVPTKSAPANRPTQTCTIAQLTSVTRNPPTHTFQKQRAGTEDKIW